MIEVFITNIQNTKQAEIVMHIIKNEYAHLKINFDMHGNRNRFPCGHTIMRVEGFRLNTEGILLIVRNLGYQCEILVDKICINN
jgi:hypothetical protein